MNAYNTKIAKDAIKDARRANRKAIEYKKNPVTGNDSYVEGFKKMREHNMCVARKVLAK